MLYTAGSKGGAEGDYVAGLYVDVLGDDVVRVGVTEEWFLSYGGSGVVIDGADGQRDSRWRSLEGTSVEQGRVIGILMGSNYGHEIVAPASGTVTRLNPWLLYNEDAQWGDDLGRPGKELNEDRIWTWDECRSLPSFNQPWVYDGDANCYEYRGGWLFDIKLSEPLPSTLLSEPPPAVYDD